MGVLLLMTHLLLESLACSVATFIDNLEIELSGSVKSPLALLNPPSPLSPPTRGGETIYRTGSQDGFKGCVLTILRALVLSVEHYSTRFEDG